MRGKKRTNPITFRADKHLTEVARRCADRRGCSLSDLIRDALRRELGRAA